MSRRALQSHYCGSPKPRNSIRSQQLGWIASPSSQAALKRPSPFHKTSWTVLFLIPSNPPMPWNAPLELVSLKALEELLHHHTRSPRHEPQSHWHSPVHGFKSPRRASERIAPARSCDRKQNWLPPKMPRPLSEAPRLQAQLRTSRKHPRRGAMKSSGAHRGDYVLKTGKLLGSAQL